MGRVARGDPVRHRRSGGEMYPQPRGEPEEWRGLLCKVKPPNSRE